ncbi:MFS transporter [Glutamicibacter uratoxydans]|uniref:MFS transporter n=1 Tax=Glutamicibacter uratoxydans TaxID=43667 RepID=UPI003D6F822C
MKAKDVSLVPTLFFAALSTAVVSSWGMLRIPVIAREFEIKASSAQWMLTTNLFVGAVSTPVLGRLSDGPHKKRLLSISFAITFAGSIITAVAPRNELFIVGRILQGVTYGANLTGSNFRLVPYKQFELAFPGRETHSTLIS